MRVALCVLLAAALSASAAGEYDWQLVAGKQLDGRDWISVGACWVFDDADRSTVKRETVTHRAVTTETVTDQETGEQSTVESVVETPEVVTIREPGDEYDGAGVYVSTPIWTFGGAAVTAGAVAPAADISQIWGAVGLAYTFPGWETENYIWSSVQVGALLILEDAPMWAVTLGLAW